MNNTICVMLSAYNGEKYIEQQIDSILNQKNVNVNLVIRDDGSSDKTVEIIKKIQKKHDNIALISQNKNLGCEESFFELLYSGIDADFYAFADQDDFWYDSKLERCLNRIKDENGPALVGTNLLVVGPNLEEIKVLHSAQSLKKAELESKYNYLANMHGCVLFWNRALQDIIVTYRPQIRSEHDVWVCAVANSVGIRRVISEPLIKYRIHGNNVSGYALTPGERIKKRLKLYLGKNHPQRNKVAQELINGYASYMDKSLVGYKNLTKLAYYKKSVFGKINLMFSSFFRGISFERRLFWMLCILLGKF